MSQVELSKTKISKPAIVVEGPPPAEPPSVLPQPSQEDRWDRAIRGLIYALAFFLPLVVTPWTFERLEFSKQMLLFVLTASALIAWIMKVIISRSWRFVQTPLDLPIGVFGALYLLAALFSVDRIASFLGFYGSFSGNFFQLLFLILFYYVVINNFQTLRQLRFLFSIFFFSVFLALLYVLLQFSGVFVLRLSFAQAESFNTIGGLLTVSLFAAFALVLALALPSTHSWFRVPGGRVWRIGAMIAAVVVLLTVNFVYAWAALLVGVIVYMVAQVAFSKVLVMKNFITPLVFLILIISFLVVQFIFPYINLRSILNFNLPREVRLDYTTAQPVIIGVIRDRPILGEGPNTFSYAFSRYRAQDFNLTPFWNVRFDKGPSEAAEYLVGSGILGFLAFEILSAGFLFYGALFLWRRRDSVGWPLAAGLYSAFAAMWFAHWFFFFNVVMSFSFWLTMAGFMAVSRLSQGDRVKVSSFSFGDAPRRAVSMISVASFAFVMIVVFLFFASSVYAADIFFRRGLAESNDAKTYDLAQANFERAIRLNQFRPDYFLTYGEFLFLRINQELSQRSPNPVLVQKWLATSIEISRAAINLSPDNWTGWERLANLYSSARPLVAGVDKFIIDSLQTATEKDPKNPILFAELGQVYRLAAQQIDPSILGRGADTDADGLSDEQEKVLGSDPANPDSNGNNVLDGNETVAGLNPAGTGALPSGFLAQYLKSNPESLLKAEQAFQKAIALKADYAAAYYQLALTYEQQKKLPAAAEVLEKALARFPNDVGMKFELGVIYFNVGQTEQAARQFQEVVALDPNNVNARFSLALSHEKLGRLSLALVEYRKLLELLPGNQDIQSRISALEAQTAGTKK